MTAQLHTTFAQTTERDVTRALVREFASQFDEYTESDVLIAGAGPSGLMCAKALAERGVKVLVIERNNYLGGGFWVGGYLMNKVVFRAPADQILDDLGVPYIGPSDGLCIADGPHACSKLIAAACDAGAKFLGMTSADDLVLRDHNRVAGLVINWSPVHSLPRQLTCVDPVGIEANLVIDATGHDAAIARFLANWGLIEISGCGPMCVSTSEDEVVARTGEIHPGLLAVGMAVASIYGLPRMGPSFGAMLLSGARGAEIALDLLRSSGEPTALDSLS